MKGANVVEKTHSLLHVKCFQAIMYTGMWKRGRYVSSGEVDALDLNSNAFRIKPPRRLRV